MGCCEDTKQNSRTSVKVELGLANGVKCWILGGLRISFGIIIWQLINSLSYYKDFLIWVSHFGNN